MGLQVSTDEIITAPYAAVLHLRQMGNPTCRLIVAEATREEFSAFPQSDDSPDVIVVGGLEGSWSYDLLNSVFRQMMDGVEIVALHKGKYWQEPDGLRIDVGVYVAGLEYVTGKSATVIGKPSAEFFRLGVTALNLTPDSVAMIGDDIVSDVGGAQRAGLKGVVVQTGKYRPELATASGVVPDAVLDSIASLPALF
jgi:HAD superfamily hydrolase (TIGR01458 family)